MVLRPDNGAGGSSPPPPSPLPPSPASLLSFPAALPPRSCLHWELPGCTSRQVPGPHGSSQERAGVKSRWSSLLWMSFTPPAAAWGPRRGRGARGRWRAWQTARRPLCLCPSEPPQVGDGVRSVGCASQGGTASSRCSAHAKDPGAEVGPWSTAQIKYGRALSAAASVGARRPFLGVYKGSCVTLGQDAGGESSASR